MKYQDCLKHWRESRGLTEPQSTYDKMMLEEIEEYHTAIKSNDMHETIDALADMLVLTENAIAQYRIEPLSVNESFEIDQIKSAMDSYADHFVSNPSDISDFLHELLSTTRHSIMNHMKSLEYNYKLVMKQVCKHISDRAQCPVQNQQWADNPSLCGSEKWLKDPNQDHSTIYQPDYKLCRI